MIWYDTIWYDEIRYDVWWYMMSYVELRFDVRTRDLTIKLINLLVYYTAYWLYTNVLHTLISISSISHYIYVLLLVGGEWCEIRGSRWWWWWHYCLMRGEERRRHIPACLSVCLSVCLPFLYPCLCTRICICPYCATNTIHLILPTLHSISNFLNILTTFLFSLLIFFFFKIVFLSRFVTQAYNWYSNNFFRIKCFSKNCFSRIWDLSKLWI